MGAGFHVRLITGHHPIGRFDDLAAILDAGIGKAMLVTGLDSKGAAQFKVVHHAVGPDEEGIFLRGMLVRCLAGNGAVLDRPQFGNAAPARESLPLKMDLKPASESAADRVHAIWVKSAVQKASQTRVCFFIKGIKASGEG